ncbi:hypothetical protein EHO61_10155 [Leptospira fluminis]|uniref:Uncharacterized protein n=2 Tax=Leptospira fluminis TaxID=2484979 RepID=A0A4R9GNY8_9LEPT|nr:hypothetical protein [Leptospira fluminis]TGK18146.1 hypothetical protein EHO61_10155 [Leptospira fluminis]
MKNFKYILLLIIFMSFLQLEGQEELRFGSDCITAKDNESLYRLSKMKDEDTLQGDFIFQSLRGKLKYGRWSDGLGLATSHLRPKGKAAADLLKSKPSEKNIDKYNEWLWKTCENALYDGLYEQHDRAYCTDKNKGVGEIILSYIAIKSGDDKFNYFYILPGKQNSAANYLKYNRPKDITIYYLVTAQYGASQVSDKQFTDPALYQRQKVTLSDRVGYQRIDIKNFEEMYEDIYETKSGKSVVLILAGIEVNSVYEGSIYKDITCIGDIGNFNTPDKFQYVPK